MNGRPSLPRVFATCVALLTACPSSGVGVPPVFAGSAVVARAERWAPTPGTTWQWQLTTPVDIGVDVQAYEIDGFEASPALVSELHAKGRKVICYVEAGGFEDFRPDGVDFPAGVIGKGNRWPGEKWLDIRKVDILGPIVARRFDMCRQKGFDAVEADLVDGYVNDTGFPLTAADQLAFNRMLSSLAHDRGLAIALKNDVDQVTDLVGVFDFAVNEQCVQYGECAKLIPFIQAGKAVFHVEYEVDTATMCAETATLGFSSMRKNQSLDGARWPC